MYRFFVEPEQVDMEEKQIIITGPDVNHMKNVLRMKPGEQIVVSAGDSRELACSVENLETARVTARILYVQETGLELPARITLYQGLPKSDKMEWIIQKAVELGAYEIVPVVTRRTVVKLDQKKRGKRRKTVAGHRGECGQAVQKDDHSSDHPVMDFREAADRAAMTDVPVIPYEMAEDMAHTRKNTGRNRPGENCGGVHWSGRGIRAGGSGIRIVQGNGACYAGKTDLRTETAGMTVLSVLMYLLEGRK